MKMQNMVVNKRLWIVMALVYALMLSSCGNVDEPESQDPTSPTGATGIERQILGTWTGDMGTLSLSFTLLTNGKVISTGENGTGWYEWNYNPDTGILATTMPRYRITGGESLQWQLTLISEESWTGLSLGQSPTSFVAKRGYAETSLYNIIAYRDLWLSNDKKKMPLSTFYGNFYIGSSGNPYNGTIVESREDDTITIWRFTVHHPYDYDNVYIEDGDDGTCYYPKDDLFE